MISNDLNLSRRHKFCVLANSGSVGNKSTKMRYDRHFENALWLSSAIVGYIFTPL